MPLADRLAGRLLSALTFVDEGWSIISTYSGATAYLEKFGVPGILLRAVIGLEFGGGPLIAVGVMTRTVGAAFAVFLCSLQCSSREVKKLKLPRRQFNFLGQYGGARRGRLYWGRSMMPSRTVVDVMDWARILAYVTGTVDQELLARNEYLAAENRILKAQLKVD